MLGRSEELGSVELFIPLFWFNTSFFQWNHQHHCAVPSYVCLASTLGLSFPLIYWSQDKTFNKAFSRMWKLKHFHIPQDQKSN